MTANAAKMIFTLVFDTDIIPPRPLNRRFPPLAKNPLCADSGYFLSVGSHYSAPLPLYHNNRKLKMGIGNL
jgi:hypothetical protein